MVDAARVEHGHGARRWLQSFAAERIIAAQRAARVGRTQGAAVGQPQGRRPGDAHQVRLGRHQFSCLDRLWTRESKWSLTATNPSSGAYGIPQALPGTKMASAGSDWRHNPLTQITWGLSYIRTRYGSPVRRLGPQRSLRLVLTALASVVSLRYAAGGSWRGRRGWRPAAPR